MLDSLDKGKTIKLLLHNYLFLFLQCLFCLRKDDQELNMEKSLVIKFKIARNWAGFTMESRYLLRKRFHYSVMSCF